MPGPKLHAASRGTGRFRRLASSTTIDAAQIRPSPIGQGLGPNRALLIVILAVLAGSASAGRAKLLY